MAGLGRGDAQQRGVLDADQLETHTCTKEATQAFDWRAELETQRRFAEMHGR